jgi:hypothetical protein
MDTLIRMAPLYAYTTPPQNGKGKILPTATPLDLT